MPFKCARCEEAIDDVNGGYCKSCQRYFKEREKMKIKSKKKEEGEQI